MQIWKVTGAADMFRFLPLVISNMARPPQRAMFIRMLLWAIP